MAAGGVDTAALHDRFVASSPARRSGRRPHRGRPPTDRPPSRVWATRRAVEVLPAAGIAAVRIAVGCAPTQRPEMDDTDDVLFGVNVAGGSLARQGRRELTIVDGDAVFLNLDAGPFAL